MICGRVMAIYKIKIIETLEKIVEVGAIDKKDALEIAQEKYTATEDNFILSADDYSGVKFQVVEDD